MPDLEFLSFHNFLSEMKPRSLPAAVTGAMTCQILPSPAKSCVISRRFFSPRWPPDGSQLATMAHHVGGWCPKLLPMAQDDTQEASKMAQEASRIASDASKTPPDEPQEAKNHGKNNVFSMILALQPFDAAVASGGPSGAPREPQDCPRWP